MSFIGSVLCGAIHVLPGWNAGGYVVYITTTTGGRMSDRHIRVQPDGWEYSVRAARAAPLT